MAFCVRPGIDGPVEATSLPSDGCCPPSVCNLDPCALACQFLNLLPSGPLWDDAKREGAAAAAAGPCDDGSCPSGHCNSIADHATYTANKLWAFARMFLVPMERNSSPFRTSDGIEFWLSALGWDDCSECYGGSTIGSILAVVPVDLRRAVQRGIVIALARSQLAPIMTLDAVNFIIRDLGVYLQPEYSNDPWRSLATTQGATEANLVDGDEIDCGCVAEGCADQVGGENCVIRPLLNFSLRLHSDTLVRTRDATCEAESASCATYPAVSPCSTCSECDLVPAWFDQCDESCVDVGGLSMKVWPGAMAAMCIVQQLLPAQANITLQLKT